MQASLISLSQHRFIVARTEESCAVKGIILADTRFDRYRDLFLGASIVSLRDVVFASWAGVDAFLSFISSLDGSVVLTDIRVPFLEIFALQVPAFPNVELGSVLTSRSRETGPAALVSNSDIDIKAVLQNGNAGPLFVNEAAYTGSLLHILGPYLEQRGSKELCSQLLDYTRSRSTFSLQFLCFAQAVVRTTLNQLQTIDCSCLQNASEVLDRINKAKEGLTLIGIQNSGLPEREEVIKRLETLFLSVTGLLVTLNGDLANWIEQAKSAGIGSSDYDVTNPSQRGRLESLRNQMNEFGSHSDNVGAAASEVVMGLSCGSTVWSLVSSVQPAQLGESILERLSDSFFVVDVFAAQSWETLLPEIKTELDMLDTMVMNLVVELQGFDAAKQVMQKRAVEIAHLLNGLEGTGAIEAKLQTEIQESLLEVISGKLVTVQERMLFGALLGDYKKLEQDFMETQEVSFFL